LFWASMSGLDGELITIISSSATVFSLSSNSDSFFRSLDDFNLLPLYLLDFFAT
jgi:hypothetical protein